MLQENTVQSQINRIRDLINIPWKHYGLRQDRALFPQLCSALDVIGDTEEAITAFETKELGGSKAAHYLAVYGLLQAMFVQQDAVFNLCELLGVEERIQDYPELKEIREVRNVSVGHPTKRDRPRGSPISYHHISRRTLDDSGFTLLSFFEDGRSQFRHIEIAKLMTEQIRFICEILSVIVSKLEQEERAHKEEFRMEKLTGIFPNTLGYHIEKVFEGIFREDLAEFAMINLDTVSKTLQDFREAVGRRDMDFYESLQDEYDLIEHAISHLDGYFKALMNDDEPETDKLTIRIFAIFLRNQVDGLKRCAQDIDREYAE